MGANREGDVPRSSADLSSEHRYLLTTTILLPPSVQTDGICRFPDVRRMLFSS